MIELFRFRIFLFGIKSIIYAERDSTGGNVKAIKILILMLMTAATQNCSELQQEPHDNCDIVINNDTEQFLWIMIDGIQKGMIKNDGLKYAMWEGISAGNHRVDAFDDMSYSIRHCWSNTPALTNGEDFYWHLLPDHKFTGTWEGDCEY